MTTNLVTAKPLAIKMLPMEMDFKDYVNVINNNINSSIIIIIIIIE